MAIGTERACDGADGFAARHAASSQHHPPAGEIFDRSLADQLTKSGREPGSRQADLGGEGRHRAAPRRFSVDGLDCSAHLLVAVRK